MTTVRLVLAGVATAEVLSAVAGYLVITSDDPRGAESALRWMLGGLAGTTWTVLWIPAAAVLAGTAVLLGLSRPLNLLLAGEEAAASLGLDVHRFRAAVFVLVALMIGTVVAVSGSIGFVGLITPHVVRLLVGADHRRALPAVALLGAAFLIIADLAARTLTSPEEIPVGILTALVGGPFFLYLMHRKAPPVSAPEPVEPGTLRAVEVSVAVSGRLLVNRVSLSAGPAEIVGVVGPNGAGKSTLLRTFYRALRPTSGRVLLEGDDIWKMPGKNLARRLAASSRRRPATSS